MRRLFLILGVLSVLAVSAAGADSRRLRHPQGCCDQTVVTRSGTSLTRRASGLTGDVRIPIILAAYTDVPFTVEEVRQVWDDIANKPGYSGHGAMGSMADYFLEQSRGQFRVTFDVLGPVTLPQERAYYGKNSSAYSVDSNISRMIKDACDLAAGLPDVHFSDYDWNGDGTVETVLVVYAGVGENVKGAPSEAVWPKQSSVSHTVDGCRLSKYACANELVWPNSVQDGFGTLLHEFSHCLGLPDLYNVDSSVDDYIVFDEWDLMDGGCYAGDSWCPVGYSAYERYLCGWLEPEELTGQATIEQLKPLTDGGQAYLIRNNDNRDVDECFLLENRQHQSFDVLLPGHGLLITHVSGYGSSTMRPNDGPELKVYPVPADDLEYRWSLKKYVQDYYGVTLPDNALNLTSSYKTFLYDEQGRSRLMTGTAYPYVQEGVVLNDQMKRIPSKPVTDIRETDGFISFQFMDPISALSSPTGESLQAVAYYDLHGRRLTHPAPGTVTVVRYADGSTRKIVR